ncbi:unnamed protein product [Brachionus calyciflorus]|uniref:Uncharacterized protein n=1 Tax=Brachionus calyciflorus TaxID=104777 RepID=A0A813M8I7_9BILA|nr:unnamed protein product [Brachionus calyciflorus]
MMFKLEISFSLYYLKLFFFLNNFFENPYYYEKNGRGYGRLSWFNLTSKFTFSGRIFFGDGSNEYMDIYPLFDSNNHHLAEKKSVQDSHLELNPNTIFLDDSIQPTILYFFFYKEKRNKHLFNKRRKYRKKRNFKENPQIAYIRLLIITDPSIYEQHKKFLKTDDDTKIFKNILHYYALTIDGVNHKYQNSFENDPDLRIIVNLENVLILTDKSQSLWSNSEEVLVKGFKTFKGKEVISRKSLDLFSNYVESLNLNFEFNHAMGVFNKDLWNTNEDQSPAQRSSLLGAAYSGAICEYSYSILEDHGGFSNLYVIAHELGHSLGASHDQSEPESKDCDRHDYFLMSPILSYSKIENIQRFSQCSIKQLKNFILDNGEISEQARCLKNQIHNKYEGLNFIKTGKIWNVEDQCKMRHGSDAVYCQSTVDTICSYLYCRVNNQSSCISNGPAVDGTFCSTEGKCYNGICTGSEFTINSENNFIYGDDLVDAFFYGLAEKSSLATCHEWFEILKHNNKSVSFYCNRLRGNKECCQSCSKFTQLTCEDYDFNCPNYIDYCLNGTLADGDEIKELFQVCPRTCHYCDDTPLECFDGLCKNGATCLTNQTESEFFGFKCICPNGFKGSLCEIRNLSSTNDEIEKILK